MEPTNNDPATRSWDPHGQSSHGDFTKYNPWRAPGHAPVVDPCGVASGMTNPSSYATIPAGYEATAKGTEVLPEGPKTYWKAGATAEVAWALSAQHGGGYSYRLCPKDSQITEECFQSNHLSFANSNHTIKYHDGSHSDFQIPTTTYVAPDGKQWRRNPIPGCACDIGLEGCGGKEAEVSAHGHVGGNVDTTVYPIHGSATPYCHAGTMFEPGWLDDGASAGFLVGGSNHYSIFDEIHVPNKAGEYMLSWRWDCEQTDQVWNSCADIVITDGPIPSTTTAATTPAAPTPAPSPSDVCANFKPDAEKFACYYHGCKQFESDGKTCAECCTGCHLQTDPSKGTFCMEDKTMSV